MKKTYAIVISSYRYGHLAAHAIESVLSQTNQFDTIYFVDDGVGDCTHLPSIYPEVKYVFREKNLGIVDNFQDMLYRVTETMVMFMGADNWLRSDALEKLKLYGNDADVITYDIMITGEKKQEFAKYYPNDTTFHNGDIYWERHGSYLGSMLYDIEFVKGVGGYLPSNHTEDFDLWDRMIVLGGAKVSYIDAPLLFYRRHRENFNK